MLLIILQPALKLCGFTEGVPKPLQMYAHAVDHSWTQNVVKRFESILVQRVHCHPPQNDDWGVSSFPFIPGHEVVGVVSAKGSQVKSVEVGDRVGVGWIKDSCRACLHCLRGQENICTRGYTGLIVEGESPLSLLPYSGTFAFFCHVEVILQGLGGMPLSRARFCLVLAR